MKAIVAAIVIIVNSRHHRSQTRVEPQRHLLAGRVNDDHVVQWAQPVDQQRDLLRLLMAAVRFGDDLAAAEQLLELGEHEVQRPELVRAADSRAECIRPKGHWISKVGDVAKTLIDVDPDLLRQAKDVLATDTKKATVNAALAEVVALHARRVLLADAAAGAFSSAKDLRTAAWQR